MIYRGMRIEIDSHLIAGPGSRVRIYREDGTLWYTKHLEYPEAPNLMAIEGWARSYIDDAEDEKAKP